MRSVIPTLTLAACLAVPSLASAQEEVSDPWEGMNRNLFAVHETVDQAVLEPVARGYRAVTPRPVRGGVRNFLRNLRSPVTFANDLLQGELSRAGTTAARFGINTTVGLVGVLDPATSMGFERHSEDFGQTLAVWGVEPGPYLFIPLLGPSNVRDSAGRIVDTAFDPLTWVGGEDIDGWRIARGVTTGIVVREEVLEAVDDIRANSVDPYASIRTSHNLLRQSAIENGRTDVQDLPEFDDIPDTQETPPGGGAAMSFLPSDQNVGLAYLSVDDLTGDAE